MVRASLPARESGLFSGRKMNIRAVSDVQLSARKRNRFVAQPNRSSKEKFIDGVVNGERVLIAKDPAPSERGIQLQIVTALSAAGVRVLQHRIYPCHRCGQRPSPQTGLGAHAADLLCIVPPYGRACFIEVKRPKTRNAKRDALQREWARWIRKFGGVAGVATSVDEAMALVEQARRLP